MSTAAHQIRAGQVVTIALLALLTAAMIVLGVIVYLDRESSARLEARISGVEKRSLENKFDRQAGDAAMSALVTSLIQQSLISAKDARKAVDDAYKAAGDRPVGPVLDNLFERMRNKGAARRDTGRRAVAE